MISATVLQKRYPKVFNLGVGLAQGDWIVKLMAESEAKGKEAKFEDAMRQFRKTYKRVDDGLGGYKWVLKTGEKNPEGETITPPRYVVVKEKIVVKKGKPLV